MFLGLITVTCTSPAASPCTCGLYFTHGGQGQNILLSQTTWGEGKTRDTDSCFQEVIRAQQRKSGLQDTSGTQAPTSIPPKPLLMLSPPVWGGGHTQWIVVHTRDTQTPEAKQKVESCLSQDSQQERAMGSQLDEVRPREVKEYIQLMSPSPLRAKLRS